MLRLVIPIVLLRAGALGAQIISEDDIVTILRLSLDSARRLAVSVHPMTAKTELLIDRSSVLKTVRQGAGTELFATRELGRIDSSYDYSEDSISRCTRASIQSGRTCRRDGHAYFKVLGFEPVSANEVRVTMRYEYPVGLPPTGGGPPSYGLGEGYRSIFAIVIAKRTEGRWAISVFKIMGSRPTGSPGAS